jgi:hypothetical protein
MQRFDARRHAGSGLASQHFHHSVARRAKDLNARCRIKRLRVRGCGTLGNYVHVKRHRVSVRMDLDDRDLRALFVRVFVECEQLWFVRLDEPDQAWHSRPLVVELPRLEPVGGDENERAGHGVSSRSWATG